jgi:hypothetical protein
LRHDIFIRKVLQIMGSEALNVNSIFANELPECPPVLAGCFGCPRDVAPVAKEKGTDVIPLELFHNLCLGVSKRLHAVILV